MSAEQKIVKRIKIAIIVGACVLFVLATAVIAGFATIGARKAEKLRLQQEADSLKAQIAETQERKDYFESDSFLIEYALIKLGVIEKHDPFEAS